jgi:tetratricopeptide (TPR) repeat protein
LASCTEGLRQLEELGYREGQAATWHSLGTVHRRLGQVDEAIRCFRRAADIFRELGHRYREAQTIADLGDAYLAGGETIVARLLWQYSVAALDRLGHPLSHTVRARLAARDNAA